jgi:thiamine pyrophosphate-dependent acetolactate synthase large subunit-like protein
MLVREAIIEFFGRRNVAHIFHLPGIHTLPLCESIGKSDIYVILGRHESNCAFMADGYSRCSGRVGIVVATPGPGLGNVATPCMEACGAGVPLLILHIDTDPKKRGKGMLHEIENPESILANATKAVFTVSNPDDLPPLLDKAYTTAISERCGPVVISVPHTLLEKRVSKVSWGMPLGQAVRGSAHYDPAKLEAALQDKERPVIIGGHALMRAALSQQIERLCEAASIPLLTTTSAKGLVSDNLSFALGNVMSHGIARFILSQADVVIAIGTRLRNTDTRGRGVKLKSLVHIDVDDEWMGKNYGTDLKIVCRDLSLVVADLTGLLEGRRSVWNLEEIKAEQARERRPLLTGPGYAVTALLRSVVPSGTTTVWDPSLISYWAEYYFPVLGGESFIMPSGMSPIFYAVPAAIGAKLARPDQPCLCVTGDGSSLPALSELSTVKKYDIPVVFLVYNNDSYGVLDQYMTKRYCVEGAMNLSNPDFVKLAEAFGIKSARAKTLDELGTLFQKNVTWKEPFLIEFDFPAFPPPWQI